MLDMGRQSLCLNKLKNAFKVLIAHVQRRRWRPGIELIKLYLPLITMPELRLRLGQVVDEKVMAAVEVLIVLLPTTVRLEASLPAATESVSIVAVKTIYGQHALAG